MRFKLLGFRVGSWVLSWGFHVVSRRFCQCMRFRLLGPHIWEFPKIGDPNVLP